MPDFAGLEGPNFQTPQSLLFGFSKVPRNGQSQGYDFGADAKLWLWLGCSGLLQVVSTPSHLEGGAAGVPAEQSQMAGQHFRVSLSWISLAERDCATTGKGGLNDRF